MSPKVKVCVFVAMVLAVLFSGLEVTQGSDLTWSTFLGGTVSDLGYDIAVDDSGRAVVTGQTSSSDFPTTTGAYDESHNGQSDVFVARLNPTGTALDYATYLGGSALDEGYAIALDDSDKVYVTGLTWSADFPVSATAFDTSHNGQMDVFVAKLNASGSALEYSTFLGGDGFDQGQDVAIEGAGYAYVTGTTGSQNFPYTSGAYDTTNDGGDAFAVKLNLTGSGLEYATFMGGSLDEEGYGIATDGAGRAYITGATESVDFPTTTGAYDEVHNGNNDVFVAWLNASGSDLDYSTYLGGENDDYGYGIAVDDSGKAFVTGVTYFSENFPFPTTTGAYDTTHNGDDDAFVAKLNATGSALSYATLLGGNNSDIGWSICLDQSSNAYVTGETYSTDFPTSTGAFDTLYGGNWEPDAFMTKFTATGDDLSYSTFLGGTNADIGYGIALDQAGNVHLTGETYSSDFPTTTGVLDTTQSNGEAFVAKFDLSGSDLIPPEAIDDLAIALESGPKQAGDIRLWWTEPYDDMGVSRYVIYRSTSAGSLGDSLAGTTDTTYLDTGAAGDVDTNYCYVVKAVDGVGNKSEQSNKVGEYDHDLKTTTGTDYTWIAFCLGDTSLHMASDLEVHIENNSSDTTNCYTISEWNATAQAYTNYTTIPVPAGDFPVQPGNAYRVEVSTEAVWTLVGDVLPSDSVSFQLKTTTGTDYTWISLPMHLAILDSTSDLEAHIEANSSPTTDCYTISEWNATAQAYTNYTTIPEPAGNFPIRPGRAYRVEVSLETVWPAGGKGVESSWPKRQRR